MILWGCFSILGIGPLATICGTVVADAYVEVLDDVFTNQYREACLQTGTKMIFMQDNAPAHTAARVTTLLAENDIDVLPKASPVTRSESNRELVVDFNGETLVHNLAWQNQ